MSIVQSFFTSHSRLNYLVVFIIGALNVFAFAPFDFWIYSLISVTLLILVVNRAATTKTAFRYGFFYGFGWFATGISWVHVAIADFGGLPLPVSILLMVILDAYLALFPAFACYLAFKFRPQLGVVAILPAWILCEWLRSVVLTGFPWLSLGYSQISGPLAGWAPIIGEIGLQALVIILALCFYSLVTNRRQKEQRTRRLIASVAAVAIFTFGLTSQQIDWAVAKNTQVNISLVQGNIAQSIKWQPDREIPTMETYLSLTQPELEFADIVIWPEAAVPRLEIIANDFLREVDELAASTDTALVTGIADYQPDTHQAYNNLIVLGKKHEQDEFGHYKYLHNNRFSKHHLLPIGEFIPFESLLRGLAPLFDLPMSSFSRGHYQQDNLIAKDLRLSPAICFEIAFADQVRANLYTNDKASDLILTVSNDAWFGDTHGPWQHLQIAQMRALEFAKPVVRVTNNGVTAFIDEKGKLISVLPQFEAGILRQTLSLSSSLTPYRQWGDGPLHLALVLLVVMQLVRRKKAKQTCLA